MEGVGWILTIVLGGLAGWIAEKVMKRNHGLLTNLIVGVIGALIGGFLHHGEGACIVDVRVRNRGFERHAHAALAAVRCRDRRLGLAEP